MLNPQLLTAFSAIVSAGSISAAATRLGCGKSVISRQLARLEADLGARLIQRTTRKLTLTEVGKVVLLEAQQIDRALSNVAQISGQFQQEVRGPLRIACPRPLGQRHLVPLITEFTRRYPHVEVTLLVEDRLSDLIAEQIDVAIRVAQMEDSTLVARKLADNPRVLVAAPSYLERAGAPLTPEDLAHHECLLWTRENRVYDEWPLSLGGTTTLVRVQGRIRINDGMALVATASSGAGITLLDRLLVEQELASGALVELLPTYSLPPGPPIYAVYPARQWLALNTATFVEFLQSKRFGERS
ncbi:LysR family transcriptional regulator [Rhodoferax sp.]|uniref:LysR family transcriptional regulator n=1 Tax=Rhodoferax sp. TaxID=50421 RepID=UPI001EB6DAB6|nr:LysR family transcriptional regulator [Rhodoferax sp.]MBT9506234.1 LysR family transcriptional regulator [Rhodoferax sp.]